MLDEDETKLIGDITRVVESASDVIFKLFEISVNQKKGICRSDPRQDDKRQPQLSQVSRISA